jgi:hypothetical protein
MAVRVFCLIVGAMLSLPSLWALSASAASAQSPDIDVLMERVGDYVHGFIDGFCNVVAEERYEPDRVRRGNGRLRSDFLLVRKPGSQRQFLTFRDVVEVNGKVLRNREEALSKLFLKPSDDVIAQANAITAHSADYMFPGSDPLLVMVFLQPEFQTRFTFTRDDIEPRFGADIRRVHFEETTSPTLLKQENDRDLPTRGMIWASERTGKIVKTELRLGSDPTTTTISTIFGRDESLGVDVPTILEQTYYPSPGEVVKGTARYSNFRRFSVSTAEKIDSLPEP